METVSLAQLRRYVVAHQGYATRFRRGRAADVAATVGRLREVLVGARAAAQDSGATSAALLLPTVAGRPLSSPDLRRFESAAVASRARPRLAVWLVPALALPPARATLAAVDVGAPAELDAEERELLERYVAAFEAYDLDRLTGLLREDALMSMPPYALWLQDRDDIVAFLEGPGSGCRGSKLVRAPDANGLPAWGQYKPSPDGGHDPWALMAVELSEGRVGELTFFLDTQRLFPLFELPDRLP